MGVGLVLMHGLVPKAMEWGLEEAEFSWVLESNSLSYGSLKKGGAKITKTYRLYDWEGGRGRRAESGGRSRRTKWTSDGRSQRLRPSAFRVLCPPPWKSAKSAAAAISTGSSNCRGGSTPKIRTGCRRC